jgi:hypothetical protein
MLLAYPIPQFFSNGTSIYSDTGKPGVPDKGFLGGGFYQAMQ